MRAVDIIVKKRDGEELTKEEIEFFIQGYTRGDIPDYQASAWCMAVLLKGMNDRETTDLTLAMAHSGEVLDLSKITGIVVDKHSTGGVGDKTTLAVEPLVASCGLSVGKMSGRGLGFSGGTLDKFESIPGIRVDLSPEEFIAQLQSIGLVLTGQSANLAPADGKLYSLRDVTGTVQSLPLIASSVMSKKIAAGAQAIILDVKLGHGAFMQTLEDARKLAQLMVQIGKLSDRRVVALLSDMNQPLGCAVGNALELREAMDTLQGKGPDDFTEHVLVLASHMLVLGNKASNLEEGRQMAKSSIENGKAWDKFRLLVKTQGGDLRCVDDPTKLPQAKFIQSVKAAQSGFIKEINARYIGEAAVSLGAGRAKKGDKIDPAVGIIVHHKVGEKVNQGDPIFTVHANNQTKLEDTSKKLSVIPQWSSEPCPPLPLFYGVIE
jgi:pyrimidine-nucleoside phosphorylase